MIFKEDQHVELKENYKSGTIVNEIVFWYHLYWS